MMSRAILKFAGSERSGAAKEIRPWTSDCHFAEGRRGGTHAKQTIRTARARRPLYVGRAPWSSAAGPPLARRRLSHSAQALLLRLRHTCSLRRPPAASPPRLAPPAALQQRPVHHVDTCCCSRCLRAAAPCPPPCRALHGPVLTTPRPSPRSPPQAIDQASGSS